MLNEPHHHIVKRYDQELNKLRTLVLEMGGRVEDQIHEAVRALYDEDLTAARAVVDRDRQVNDYEIRADDIIANMIALRQPMAGDLRTILGLSKIVTDLERSGDEAERIARMTLHLYEQGGTAPHPRLLRDVQPMSQQAAAMLRASLDALARRDVAKALEIDQGDNELDRQFSDALRHLITLMSRESTVVSQAIDVVFMVKALERIGDHAKNIAEYVIYMVEGKDIRHIGVEHQRRLVDPT
jgi:phosphate transport system protein